MDHPRPGTRILYNGNPGTVRYVGPVDNTSGTWLGVEWDDPQRGKHDGVKDGKQYFSCREPHSGSFIRPSANVKTGTTFLEAIRAKYLEDLHGTDTQETVILGSSSGVIQVEAVNLDKIRNKLSRLDKLRDISLDGTPVAYADPPGAIKATTPSIRSLNLSLSLLCNWEEVAGISRELVQLQRLSLSRNRLLPLQGAELLAQSFDRIVELELNDTQITWHEALSIISQMPRLESLEVSFNGLIDLGSGQSELQHANLHTLNLDNNHISNWSVTLNGLACFPRLSKVVLAANQIESIQAPVSNVQSSIKYLSLASNMLASWTDIEHLASSCSAIETLSLGGNPIMDAHHARASAIAYFPSLQVLDGTAISTRERIDSELLYLGDSAKFVSANPTAPPPFRWTDLCGKHGPPQDIGQVRDEEKISSRLIVLTLRLVTEEPTRQTPLMNEHILHLKVLPTMALRVLRAKVKKASGSRAKTIVLWMRMADGSFAKLETTDDTKALDWMGLEDKSEMAYQLR